MEAKELSHELNEWFLKNDFKKVKMQEDFNPLNDESDDYKVIYTCKFEQETLECAEMEFFLTSEGYIGISIDRWTRLAPRLNLKTSSLRVCAGQEPGRLNKEVCLELLDCVAMGTFYFSVCSVPFIGIYNIKTYINSITYHNLEKNKYENMEWLKEENKSKKGGVLKTIVNYTQWE